MNTIDIHVWLQYILAGLFLMNVLFAIRSPQKAFYLVIFTVPFINFSFIEDQSVWTRAAISDWMCLALLVAVTFRAVIFKQRDLEIPRTLTYLLTIISVAILISFYSFIPDRVVLLGDGEYLVIGFGMVFFIVMSLFLKNEVSLRTMIAVWAWAAVIVSVFCFYDMLDMFDPNKVSIRLESAKSGFFGLQDIFLDPAYRHSLFSSPLPSRISGVFRSNGQLSAYALTTFFVMLASSHMPACSRSKKIMYFILSMLMGVWVFFGMALRSMPSLIVGLLLYGIYLLWQRRERLKYLLLGILLMVVMIGSVVWVNPKVTENWARNLRFIKPSNELVILPGSWYLATIKKVLEDSPLNGVGLGRFLQTDYQIRPRAYEIHSTPLQFLAETGFIGFFSYLLFMVYYLFLGIQNVLRAWRTQWRDYYAILCIAAFSLPLSYMYNRHLRERTFWLFLLLLYAGQCFLSHQSKVRDTQHPEVESSTT